MKVFQNDDGWHSADQTGEESQDGPVQMGFPCVGVYVLGPEMANRQDLQQIGEHLISIANNSPCPVLYLFRGLLGRVNSFYPEDMPEQIGYGEVRDVLGVSVGTAFITLHAILVQSRFELLDKPALARPRLAA